MSHHSTRNGGASEEKYKAARNTGIIIFMIYIIIEVSIVEIEPMIAIAILLVSIVLILADGIKRRTKNSD